MINVGKIEAVKNDKPVVIEYEIREYDDNHTTIALTKGRVTGYEEFNIEHLIDFGLLKRDPTEKFYWCAGGMGYPELYCKCEDVQKIVNTWLDSQK